MNIYYHMYLNHTGYSISAQEYVLAIHEVNPSATIKCRTYHQVPLGVSRSRQDFFLSRRADIIEKGAICIYQSVPTIYHAHKQASKNVGICVYETLTLPPSWIKRLNSMDLVLTASEFNKGIFEANGISKPVKVVPHCFNPRMFNKDISPQGRYSQTTFFAIGQWKERKNWESLVRGFFEAFSKKDNVCLLIKTDRPELLTGAVNRIKRTEEWRSKDTCPVFSEPKTICLFEEIPSIMKKADFFVSTSLGEGFGLPGLHAMALGIPVITTRFGGALQYARPETCTYFEPSKYETRPTMDGIPQFNNSVWPVLTIQEIANKLRNVFDHYPTEKTQRAYQLAHAEFTYERVGKQFCEALT